jgi:glycosyltransferase involved in cell wall biosynthesis
MADIILLVSAYEGFPMFIKEGMAAGCVPVVTPLPGNRMHLKDGENALLISVIEPEDQVVASALECIGRLAENPDMLRHLSGHAYQYASLHFTKTAFEAAYQKLLLSGESLPLPAIRNRNSP